MPRAMQDAQACCGLYLAKNPANAMFIFRTIDSRVDDLMVEPLQPFATPQELLARTQALLLYQIIRLFDGDIRARAAAERAIPCLEDAALALKGCVQSTEHDHHLLEPFVFELSSSMAAQDSWKSWILLESIRRTCLIVLFLVSMYKRLCGRATTTCDSELFFDYTWTASAGLWEAQNAAEFVLLWQRGQSHCVTNANLLQALPSIEVDDIDTYSKILLTASLGIENTKAWFWSRGREL